MADYVAKPKPFTGEQTQTTSGKLQQYNISFGLWKCLLEATIACVVFDICASTRVVFMSGRVCSACTRQHLLLLDTQGSAGTTMCVFVYVCEKERESILLFVSLYISCI